MEAPNYRISYSDNKKKKRIVAIIVIILLLIIFRPLHYLRKTLAIRSMIYKSTHEPVYFSSLNLETSGILMKGTIIRNFAQTNSGIDIAPNTVPTTVRPVEIGIITDIGYSDSSKNYIKIRHVSENRKDIFYSDYSNLPESPNLRRGDWVGTSSIIYSGNNLDYLHFEIIDFDGNKIDPESGGYVNLE